MQQWSKRMRLGRTVFNWGCFLVLIVIAGCSPDPNVDTDSSQNISSENLPAHIQKLDSLTVYPADAEPAYDIELTRDQTFPASEDMLIGAIVGLVVDDKGRVFVADGNQKTVHAFKPDGSYITGVGRSGKGPGEFINFSLSNPMFTDSKNLYVYGPRLKRINVFSLQTFKSSGTIYIDSKSIANFGEIGLSFITPRNLLDNGSFILRATLSPLRIQGNMYKTRYYRMNPSGKIELSGEPLFIGKTTDLVKAQDFGPSSLFFSPQTLVDFTNDGYIYSAFSRELFVKVYDQNGNYLRAFYYPFENRALTRADAVEHVNSYLKDIVRDYNGLPETWPALYSLQVDDQRRIWLATITDDDETYTHWVLDSDGKLLARFDWPKVSSRVYGYKQFQVITDQYLYSRETDEETGVEQVVRYRYDMKRISNE